MKPDEGHLVVRARAGTGKTTTLIEGADRAPEDRILLCAFNKQTAEVLNSRITNPNAQAKTMHALGFAAIRANLGSVSVAPFGKRADDLTNRVCGKDVPLPIRRLIGKLHTKARDMSPSVLTQEAMELLAMKFDLEPDDAYGRDYHLPFVASRAIAAMALAAYEDAPGREGIDYADMIYLPLVKYWLEPSYGLVVVDEAQDLTLAQLEMVQRVGAGGRICVVGDDRQAIYGFRGADTGSLDRLKGELNAAELPLTTTYRCAQSIVRRARRLVSDIEAAPSNPEGIVDDCHYDDLFTLAQPGDFILSRLNAPLVSLTMRFLREKKRAIMLGKDIGAGLNSLLTKLGLSKKHGSVPQMLIRLDSWENKSVNRYANLGLLDMVDRVHDQADMLRALANGTDDVAELQTRIDFLFTDVPEGTQIRCSSIHKAKGLESDRVFVLSESLYRRGPSQEEDNLSYVSTTRAKTHLTFVTGVPSLMKRSK